MKVLPDIEEIARTMRLFVPANGIGECRIIRKSGGPIGFFFYHDEIESAARFAAGFDQHAKGVYICMNQIDLSILGERNTLSPLYVRLTKDENILRRSFVCIDCDPESPNRKADDSATDQEKIAAVERLKTVVDYLSDLGFPQPLVADSGNGLHAIYRIDLPNNEESKRLVSSFLTALHNRFSNDHARIDVSLSNASRVVRLYGSIARKGESRSHRPHRPSRIKSSPDELSIVSKELIEASINKSQLSALESNSLKFDDRHSEPTADCHDVIERARRYLDAIPPAISGQNGHNQTFLATQHLVNGFELNDQDALILLREWNNKCVPPWSDQELQHKIESARKDGKTVIHGQHLNSVVSVGATSQAPTPQDWPDPEPLPDDLPEVMAFDAGLLPDVFGDRVYDISNRMGCPPDFSAIAVVIAAASVIGRRITIRPKRFDDWTVVPNLWGCAVGRPGLMKTNAIQQAIHPLRQLANDAAAEHKKNQADLIATKELTAMKAKKIRKEVQSQLEAGETSEETLKSQLTAVRELETEGITPEKRYIVMDSSYESIGDLLTECPNGFLQFRDELAGWWASLGREGQENARSFWLECWNGDGDYYIDRIIRGRQYVPSNTVSVLGATQPGKLRSYLQGAIRQDSSDDGMVQRHQLLVWPDLSTEWKHVDQWPDNDAKGKVLEVFRRLDKLAPCSIGANQDIGDDFPYLRFSHDAQPVFDEWLGRLERQLRSDQDPPYLESHFSKYRSLIPSLALVFHLVEQPEGPVGLNSINRAIRWDAYLASHARRAYGSPRGASIESAKKLLKRIRTGELKEGFSIRSVYISHQSGLATKEEAEAAVDVLADFGWLKKIKLSTPGRPTIICNLHPQISSFLA